MTSNYQPIKWLSLRVGGTASAECIHVAPEMGKWQSVANTVRNARTSYKRWDISELAGRQSAYQEKICFMDLDS